MSFDIASRVPRFVNRRALKDNNKGFGDCFRSNDDQHTPAANPKPLPREDRKVENAKGDFDKAESENVGEHGHKVELESFHSQYTLSRHLFALMIVHTLKNMPRSGISIIPICLPNPYLVTGLGG